jgi:hypothetical protein
LTKIKKRVQEEHKTYANGLGAYLFNPNSNMGYFDGF